MLFDGIFFSFQDSNVEARRDVDVVTDVQGSIPACTCSRM